MSVQHPSEAVELGRLVNQVSWHVDNYFFGQAAESLQELRQAREDLRSHLFRVFCPIWADEIRENRVFESLAWIAPHDVTEEAGGESLCCDLWDPSLEALNEIVAPPSFDEAALEEALAGLVGLYRGMPQKLEDVILDAMGPSDTGRAAFRIGQRLDEVLRPRLRLNQLFELVENPNFEPAPVSRMPRAIEIALPGPPVPSGPFQWIIRRTPRAAGEVEPTRESLRDLAALWERHDFSAELLAEIQRRIGDAARLSDAVSQAAGHAREALGGSKSTSQTANETHTEDAHSDEQPDRL